jgi:hypothetical protein
MTVRKTPLQNGLENVVFGAVGVGRKVIRKTVILRKRDCKSYTGVKDRLTHYRLLAARGNWILPGATISVGAAANFLLYNALATRTTHPTRFT